MNDTADTIAEQPRDRLIDAMLDVLAADGWAAVSLEAAAARAGLSQAAAYGECADAGQLLDAWTRRVDVAACEGAEPGFDPQSRYDELLDVLMRRFEILQTRREVVARLARELPRDPGTLVRRLPQSLRSFAFLAGAAGYPESGVRGALFAKALSAVWLATQRDWLRDETDDLSATMASLDRHLTRAIDLLGPVLGPMRGQAEPDGDTGDSRS